MGIESSVDCPTHVVRPPTPKRPDEANGPSRDKSGILCEDTATGSPVGEPTTDPRTISLTIGRGVRGIGR